MILAEKYKIEWNIYYIFFSSFSMFIIRDFLRGYGKRCTSPLDRGRTKARPLRKII